MSVLRFVSTICLLVAVIALIADVTPAMSGVGTWSLASIEEHWKQVAPATFKSMEDSLPAGRRGWEWTYFLGPLLATPTSIFFAVLSAVAGYAGRRRTRIKIYAN